MVEGLGLRPTARELGISAPRLKALADEGRVPRRADGKFDLEAVRRAWAANRDPRQPTKVKLAVPPEVKPEAQRIVKEQIEAAPGESEAEKVRQAGVKLGGELKSGKSDGTYLQMQTKFVAVKMAKAAIELERLAGSLLPREEIRTAWEGMISTARGKLLAIGPELAPRLAGEADPLKCRTMLDDRVHQALGELAILHERRLGTA